MTTFDDVLAARRRISGVARRTPLTPSATLSTLTGAEVYCKLETLQDTGSFKLRGAANHVLSLPAETRRRGVVTVSSGNHGRAVARVAALTGTRAVICLSSAVPENKRRAIAMLGAKIVVRGATQDDAAGEAARLADEQGLAMVNPFDDPFVIAGQGTIGLEIADDLPDVDTVVVPLSGGGLAAGVALAVKRRRPGARVIGVSMEHGAAMHASVRAGRPVDVVEVDTLADALRGGIFLDNQHSFTLVRRLLDDIVLVSEEEIARGMAFALERERLVVEGGSAVGVAALLHGRARPLGRRVAVILSGANIAPQRLLEIVAGQQGWLDALDARRGVDGRRGA